ncbi:hypothetical protein GJV26_14225 [Massilia dura]|uniref:Lipoprotein LpqB beta-propeller domain-containing protein n=1 Tax=Pseudoduganella dura TaxID=321982 RepID=A0A6I3X9S5_9BURK|nr:hypothetical protein [Pseudoduganella dura]MUI13609.1 hypothetical protein [Pseudoduganella dura]GGX74060.1 hypothetical protein GCM10007386_01180 [Pseudoduganella dura]
MRRPQLPALLIVSLSMLAACGGGGGAAPAPGGNQPPPVPPPAVPVSAAYPTMAAVKTRVAADTWATLIEVPRRMADVVVPDRQLRIGTAAGTVAWQPPAGWSLVDFALHPSREITAVLSDGATLRLLRLDRQGTVLAQTGFDDPQVALDPYFGPANSIRDRRALAPWKTRDAVRIAPVGEEVALALRSGANAVVAYRLDGAWRQRWRTLVEPGVHLEASHLLGGTHDPFEGLENHWQLWMDADAQGRVVVGVSMSMHRTELAEGHARQFGETLPAGFTDGVLATSLAADGRRLAMTPVATAGKSELHALRWANDTVLLAGRVRTSQAADGTGWDGWLARVRPGEARALSYRLVDVDRGDVIFDVAQLGDGRVLVAGSTGYTQNAGGESVSEATAPLLARVEEQGTGIRRVTLAAGPRGNQVRSLAAWNANWLLAGFDNAPGTHSADGDPALLTADGWLRETALPAE